MAEAQSMRSTAAGSPLGPDGRLPRPLAFDDRPYRPRMGMRALDLDEWLVLDECYAGDLAEKGRLLEERPEEVIAARPGTEDAAGEVLAAVMAFVVAHGRIDRASEPVAPADRHPIDQAGRLVQEDLCLHQRLVEGWVLTAASLCFPQRWRLRDKLGRPLRAIHAPVSGYDEHLADPVDRALDRLDPDRPQWRLNWSILDCPDLYQPTGHDRTVPDRTITADTAADRLWLRVERQTLRRFPVHDTVLFTIRTLVWPLGVLRTDPDAARLLASAVRALPPDAAAYKSVPVWREPALAYLDSVSP